MKTSDDFRKKYPRIAEALDKVEVDDELWEKAYLRWEEQNRGKSFEERYPNLASIFKQIK